MWLPLLFFEETFHYKQMLQVMLQFPERFICEIIALQELWNLLTDYVL
jgi:hypothetical protein